jgi:hypothetical protein
MTPGSEYPTDSSASGRVPFDPGPQGYREQPYPDQRSFPQPYPQQPDSQQAAWGQHAHAQSDRRPGYQPQPTSDNPYQVTPAQYYRDQGYAEPEPEQPYPTHSRSAAPGYRAQRSSGLGGVSFGLVAAMLAICVAAAQSLGQGYRSILLAAGTLELDAADVSDEMAAPLVLPATAIGMASIVGIIGLIMGIVAAVSRRGRGWGIAAIITGLVAPVIWSTMLLMVLLPVVQALS